MRSKRVVISTCLVALLVVVLALAARYITAPPEVSPRIFPEKLSERIALPGQELGQLRQEVKYTDDGLTKISNLVYFVDGSKTQFTYHPDGINVATFKSYYPQSPDQEFAQLKSEGEYAEDGEHLNWSKHYNVAGVLVRDGKRLDDGNYLVQHYMDDGVKLAGTYVYNPEGESYSTAEFYESGVTKKLVSTSDLNAKETTLFAETGKKTSYHFERGKHIIWETYRADGTTPIHRFEQKPQGSQGGVSYSTIATYYNADGSVHHERKFGRYYMYVTVRDSAGEIELYQMWENLKSGQPDVSMEPDQWILNGVIMGGDIYSDAPSIWFHDDGHVERHVYQLDHGNGPVGRVIKVYHPDGSLASYSRPDPANPAGKNLETEYAPGESAERFDMGILKGTHVQFDYVTPPQVPPPHKSYHR